MTRAPADGAKLDRLRAAVGAAGIVADPERLASLSHDIAGPAGVLPVCIVAPESVAALQRAVAATTESGLAVVPRGGGMSYTGGYAPSADGCVLFDMTRLSAVAGIDTANRHAVVEAGCTWSALNDALRGTGFRPPSFGPLSGGVSTVGGAVSHNAMFFGSGSAGSTAGSVFGLEVVLADGRLLHTGVLRPDSVDALPHGPDLTHLFVGDCGAFGVKSRVALRLAPVAGAEAFLSMAFDDPLAMLDAQTALAGRPGLGECFTFDRQAHRKHSRPADRFPGKARRRCRRSAREPAGWPALPACRPRASTSWNGPTIRCTCPSKGTMRATPAPAPRSCGPNWRSTAAAISLTPFRA